MKKITALLFLLTAFTVVNIQAQTSVSISELFWLNPPAVINPRTSGAGGGSIIPLDTYDALFNNPTQISQSKAWNVTPLSLSTWGEDILLLATLPGKMSSLTQNQSSTPDILDIFKNIRAGVSFGVGFGTRGFAAGFRVLADFGMNRWNRLFYLNIEYGGALGYAYTFPISSKVSLTTGITVRPFVRTTMAGAPEHSLETHTINSILKKELEAQGFDDIVKVLNDYNITISSEDVQNIDFENFNSYNSLPQALVVAIGSLESYDHQRFSNVLSSLSQGLFKQNFIALLFNYFNGIFEVGASGWGIAVDAALQLDFYSFSLTAQARDFYLPAVLYRVESNTIFSDFIKSFAPVNISKSQHVFVRYIPEIRFGLSWNPDLGKKVENFFDITVYTEFVDPFGLLHIERMSTLETFLTSFHFGTEIRLVRLLALRAGLNAGTFTCGIGVDFIVGELNASLYGVDIGLPVPYENVSYSVQGMGVSLDLRFAFDIK